VDRASEIPTLASPGLTSPGGRAYSGIKMLAPRKIFVFDRKELLVLTFLSVTVAFFSFTLGVHLGKTVAPATGVSGDGHAQGVTGDEDPLPNRQEFVERGKGVEQEADMALSQSLHTEVAKTGIKLDVQRQVDLPEQPRTVEAGKTTLKKPAATLSKSELKRIEKLTPEGRYTLQVGSFPSMEEAQGMMDKLEKAGMTPALKAADLKDLGRRYRVFVGKYDSKDAATAAGNRFRDEKVIDSYVVQNRSE
jgi:cell division septation protein DedD